jgi:hypothetical protein
MDKSMSFPDLRLGMDTATHHGDDKETGLRRGTASDTELGLVRSRRQHHQSMPDLGSEGVERDTATDYVDAVVALDAAESPGIASSDQVMDISNLDSHSDSDSEMQLVVHQFAVKSPANGVISDSNLSQYVMSSNSFILDPPLGPESSVSRIPMSKNNPSQQESRKWRVRYR